MHGAMIDRNLFIDIAVGLAIFIGALSVVAQLRSGTMRGRGWTISRAKKPDLFRRNIFLELLGIAALVLYLMWRVVHS